MCHLQSLENIQHQMQEQTAALSELSVERENLLSKIESLEREHSEAVAYWQEQMKVKEESMTAEMSHLEISFKESEHMLREDVEEKANIIQVRLNYTLWRKWCQLSFK
jgi:chaperonin cofactor prefoldin